MENEKSIYLGQITTDPVKTKQVAFLLSSFHVGIEQRKKKSLDSLATENICWEYFSKSNESRCICCPASLSNVGLGNSKTHILPFLESK